MYIVMILKGIWENITYLKQHISTETNNVKTTYNSWKIKVENDKRNLKYELKQMSSLFYTEACVL